MPAVKVVPLSGEAAVSTLGRTLVLVPHPDDETIGCGGLLALLAQAGMGVHVVLVSDGAASHPHSQSHGAPRLRALRLREMRCALRELGCGGSTLTTLALPDGAVPLPGGEGYRAAFDRLASVAESFRPHSVVMPWRGDAHPDHRASQALGAAVCRHLALRARQLEYVVWPPPADGVALPMGDGLTRVWQIDITAMVARKRRALAHHRSQLGQAVFDDPEGFTLPPCLIEACERPMETYYSFKQGDIHEHHVPPFDTATGLL